MIMMKCFILTSTICFVACNDNEEDGISSRNSSTLIIDDKSYNSDNGSYINEGRKTLCINAVLQGARNISMKIVTMRILNRPFVISELQSGEQIDYKEIEVEEFSNGTTIALYENEYETLSGKIMVESVDRNRVVLRFNDLSFALKHSSNIFGEDYSPQNATIHKINGTVSFHNHLYENGDWKPFY